ncbi:hypothetical protein OBBRIDRAFT_808227 [Obba rivulosa]|uniref:Uncharacterized protein n=1 Tax=Obba rivulosa TaxID=1052685 RepID=A0A8E2ASJ9_9APHY|nr:hypothetical protein OBBRIDRAFT_808227 [Obba rivulosa]
MQTNAYGHLGGGGLQRAAEWPGICSAIPGYADPTLSGERLHTMVVLCIATSNSSEDEQVAIKLSRMNKAAWFGTTVVLCKVLPWFPVLHQSYQSKASLRFLLVLERAHKGSSCRVPMDKQPGSQKQLFWRFRNPKSGFMKSKSFCALLGSYAAEIFLVQVKTLLQAHGVHTRKITVALHLLAITTRFLLEAAFFLVKINDNVRRIPDSRALHNSHKQLEVTPVCIPQDGPAALNLQALG